MTGRGRGRGTTRRGSAIAAATASSSSRSVTGPPPATDRRVVEEGAEGQQQRVAPIFGTGRRPRPISESQVQAVVEMMAEQQATGSSQASCTSETSATSTPARSSRPPPPLEVTVTPSTSLPSLSSLFTPGTASVLRDVVEQFEEEMIGACKEEEDFEVEQFVVGEEGGDAEVVGGEELLEAGSEDMFGDDDDDVRDPNYAPPPPPARLVEGSSSEEEEVSVAQRRGSSKAASTGRGRQDPQPAASAATTTRSKPKTKPKKAQASKGTKKTQPSSSNLRLKSPVWRFFTKCTEDPTRAICNSCKVSLSRGRDLLKLSTSCLVTHLQTRHFEDFCEYDKLMQSGAGSGGQSQTATAQISAAAAAASHPAAAGAQQQQLTPPPPGSQSSVASSAPSTVASSAPSTVASSSFSRAGKRRQTLLSESFPGVTKVLPPAHRRIRLLNGLLARAMCSQLLPYSFVQEGSDMRVLLQVGIPEWKVPSRQYFSGKAIPALHRFAMANVGRALDHAVSARIHVTMDSWSSRFGTDRYLSFTAHWVSLVESPSEEAAGPPSGAAAAAAPVPHYVVPPRGVRGEAAAPAVKRHRVNSSVKARHCQALLEMVSLGKNSLTADNVLHYLREQENTWLTPRGLRVGLVVSDNAANLLAAISRGHLSHVPCLAHVLNLVVQKFLRTYQGMDELLEAARKIVRSFRRSAAAASKLAEIQQREGLPPHRLVIDVPTRWNSTLAMLKRLVEQKRAVNRFIVDGTVEGTTKLQVLTNAQWWQMKQVCLVLAPFLQGTNLVSQERASLCQWVPFVCLLDRALYDFVELREEALNQLEQQPLAQSPAAQETESLEEDEEEEELEVVDVAAEGEQRSAAAVVRGWREEEEAQEEEEEEDDPDVSLTSLFPMAAHMLRCLRTDPRVQQMQVREDACISMILDPRLRGKWSQFLPARGREQRARELQELLVRRLEEAFPQASTPSVQPAQQPVPVDSSSSVWRPGDLLSLTQALYMTVEQPREEVRAAATSSQSHSQRMTQMVAEYMGSFSGLDTGSVDPMEYWVQRLNIWSELAQYALGVLSCPPSSVLSERCFSAAGGVVTEKRSRLSTEGVDRLTFLKINQAWIEGTFLAPVVGERRT